MTTHTETQPITSARIAHAYAHAPLGRALITRSVIAGEPRQSHLVTVVAIVGDVLHYTVDGIWVSTVGTSDLASWELTSPDDTPADVHACEYCGERITLAHEGVWVSRFTPRAEQYVNICSARTHGHAPVSN